MQTIEFQNPLLAALRADPKSSKLFNTDAIMLAYKTAFPVLDYGMGTSVNVFDADGKLVETYPSVGIPAGSYITIAGKSAVGKTTLAVQIASNIVRPFPAGFVEHYDIETSSNRTRVSNLSRFPINMLDQKYVLKQIDCSLESLKEIIAKMWTEKTSNPDKYQYNTGYKDEYGKDIIAYQPTCIIVDSIASITTYINPNTKEGKVKIEEITSQTDVMRLNGEISRFLKESRGMIKEANIIVFFINHIKPKPSVGFPEQADLRYLKQNENLPCGRALQYYSDIMLRLTSVGSETYTVAEHGFDGFGVIAQFMKNRSNVDGTVVPLTFQKVKGYDPLRSNWYYAKEKGMLGGNKNGYYFLDAKDKKFTFKDMHTEFKADRGLYTVMYDHIIPVLKDTLSSVSPDELEVLDEEMAY